MFDWFWETWSRFGGHILVGLGETMYMVIVSFFTSFFVGSAIGMVLSLCSRDGHFENTVLAIPLSVAVNVVRSIPFLLLLIIMAPVARMMIGTAYGIYASMISLSVVGIAIVARLVEQAISDINPQVLQTAQSMGAQRYQVITEFIIIEARSPLILGFTSAIISLIAYSTVVGIIAGGGIGYLAVQEGFYMWNQSLMWAIIFVMILVVQIIQLMGSTLARIVDKKGKP